MPSFVITYCRLTKKEPVAALGSHQGRPLISVSTVPHRESDKDEFERKMWM